MESIEEFMHRLFEEQIALEKQEQARRAPFQEKFFTDDCLWGKRLGRLELVQSQKVQSISSIDAKAEVITSRLANAESGVFCNIRYRLEKRGQGWRICGVDLPCCCGAPAVSAAGDCPSCHGTGWRDTNNALAKLAHRDVSS